MCSFFLIFSKSGGVQPPLILVPKIQGGLRPRNPLLWRPWEYVIFMFFTGELELKKSVIHGKK